MKDTMCGLVKEENGPSGLVYHTDLPIPQINDDEVKLNVGERDEATGKWKVKLEFVETFGYLNNPKETTKSSRKPAGEKLTAQDVAAAYVNKMIQESGL